MEGWPDDWLKMLDTAAVEVEQFFQDVAKEMTEAADAFLDFSGEVADQVEQAIAPGLEQLDNQMDDWLESLLLSLGVLETTIADAAEPINQTVEPMLNQHPACVGCRHYHGQMYGGTMFVCAMYPYGWEDETCPDWESSWDRGE